MFGEYNPHLDQDRRMMQRFLRNFAITTNSPSSSDHNQRLERLPIVGRLLWPLLLCTGISCHSSIPTAPMLPSDADGYRELAMEEPAGVANDMPPKQVLLPGDLLQLQILSAEKYDPAELWVDTEGRLHIPFGGDVQVLGLELTEAEARIQEVVRKFDRYARVTLTIRSFAGHRVIVSGAVDKPGVYEAKPGTRIADIVASAGGTRVLGSNSDPVEASDVDAARIVRDGKTLPVSVKRAMFGDIVHNVYARPGDIIFIPWMMGRQIAVLGDVRQARNVPFHAGLRLTEALAAAGGPSRTADTADVRIIRGPLSRAKVYRASLDDLISGETTDVVLAPGDVIFVTEHWFATATDVINRLTPLLATAALYSTLTR
jgi:polysaccharide biosynthesis/export protein